MQHPIQLKTMLLSKTHFESTQYTSHVCHVNLKVCNGNHLMIGLTLLNCLNYNSIGEGTQTNSIGCCYLQCIGCEWAEVPQSVIRRHWVWSILLKGADKFAWTTSIVYISFTLSQLKLIKENCVKVILWFCPLHWHTCEWSACHSNWIGVHHFRDT